MHPEEHLLTGFFLTCRQKLANCQKAASDTGGVPGKNDFDTFDYGGPCPPAGTHHYCFTLYALNQELELEPGIEKADVLRAMESHVLATAELVDITAKKLAL